MRSRPDSSSALRISSAAAIAVLATTTAASAADRVWVGLGANGNFNFPANWANSAVPASVGDTAFFGFSDAGRNVVFLNANVSLAGMAVRGRAIFGPFEFRGGGSQLNVNGSFGINRGTTAFMTSSAVISTKIFYLQDTATLSMSDSRLLSIDSAVVGTLNLNAGAEFVSTGTTTVDGGGKLSIKGGASAKSWNYLDIGDRTPGTLEVDGATSLFSAGGNYPSRWAGVDGSATVTLTNGAKASLDSGLQIAKYGAQSTADVTVKSGSTLEISGPFDVTGTTASDGSATIRVESATLNVNAYSTFGGRSSLLLGTDSVARFYEGATFNNGSFLNVKEGAVLFVGADRMLTFDGGNATVQSNVFYPSSNSRVRIRGGSDVEFQGTFDLRTATLYLDGSGTLRNTSATQSSTWANSGSWVARVDILDNATVSYRNGLTICGTGGSATVAQSGGLFKSNSLTVGGGAASSAFIYLSGGKFEHASVELRRGATMYHSGGTWSGVRQLTLRDNAFLHMAAGSGLELRVQSLTLFDQARIDLNGNTAVIDYLAASPLATLIGYVRTAYNNGNWVGTGITSAAARLDPRMGIGISDQGGMVTLRATLAGDADMDYGVDFDDLLLVAANYNQSGRTWQTGDFTYDGVVNFDDLIKLASNYNQSLTGTFGGEWALARTSVPEPAGVAGIFVASLVGLRRARRSTAVAGDTV